MPEKRIVVTGATGFIGSACVRALRNLDWEVFGLSSQDCSGDGIAWRRVDLLDKLATRAVLEELRPTHLLHAAWQPVNGNVMHSLDNLAWLEASAYLAHSFRECGGQRFLSVGSVAEYDWNGGLCQNGHTPTRPATLYGTSKQSLRVILDAYAFTSGLSYVWPRVFFVYGPGEHPTRLAASVVRSLLRGERADLTHGSQVRDYLHVDDVASGIVFALESEHTGAIDIAGGQSLQVRELVTEIARQIGRDDLLSFGARPAPPSDAPVVLGDPSQAQAVLKWHPKMTLEQGVADTIAWGKRVFYHGILCWGGFGGFVPPLELF